MDVSVPPWLNVGPQSFGSAAAEGARLDLARQQADTESAMNAVRLSIQKQQSDRDFAEQQEHHAVDDAMKRQQLSMAAQSAARKYQAQNQYQQLVASGVPPADAMLKVGPSLGINMVGAGQLAHWGTPPPPPTLIDIGGKKFAQYNRTLHPIKQGPDWVDEDVNGHKFQRNTSTGELKAVLHASDVEGVLNPKEKVRATFLQNQIKALASDPLAARNPATQLKLKSYQDEFDKLTGAAPQEGDETPTATGAQSTGATSRYKIVAVQ